MTVNITFLPSTDVSQIIYTEGLGYLPKLAKTQTESLLVATEHNGNCVGHIQVVRLSDGVVTQEIIPQAGSVLCTDGIAGIAWDATNSRLLASIDQTIFQLGFDGSVVGPLATEPAAAPFWLEGLAVLNDGRIAAADYYNARVRIWDAAFNRLRSQDRGFRIQPAAHLRVGSLRWDDRVRTCSAVRSRRPAMPRRFAILRSTIRA